MKIYLVKATIEDAQEIHQMQIKSFKNLLDKYKDYDTNPGNESIEKVLARINQETTDYYLIKAEHISAGAIRIHKLENGLKCRIAPIFILPEYQNKSISRKTDGYWIPYYRKRGIVICMRRWGIQNRKDRKDK